MTEQEKKLMTEWLGECFHENLPTGFSAKTCFKCGKHHGSRTFTTWEDYGAVIERMQQLGLILSLNRHYSVLRSNSLLYWLHRTPEVLIAEIYLFLVKVGEIKEG